VKKANQIKELLEGPGAVHALRAKLAARNEVKSAVVAVLSPPLAAAVASAGLEGGELTVGVVGAAWASRLRYVTETLRTRVSRSLGTPIERVRIRVVRAPPVAADDSD
jgi:hypothetical protein